MGEIGDGIAKLYVPAAGTEGEYVALSYCCGTTNHFTTTSDNISDRIDGFNISELPRTVFEVVQATRELGFRYL